MPNDVLNGVREAFELVALFLAVWFVIFGIPLGLGALARFAGAGQ